jgi:hypothetical protein
VAQKVIEALMSKPRQLKQPPDTRKTLWWCLLVTLGADGLAALALAAGQLLVAKTGLFTTLFAAILFAIGVANLWALNSTRQAAPSWGREAVIAQVGVLLLALYIVVIDGFKDPQTAIDDFTSHSWRAVAVFAIAGTVGLLALVWILLLGGRTEIRWTKTALIITALFPLAGLLQFWLQNYYFPATSAPQVDISTELSPQGRTGSIIHLSAKVTMHNRSAAQVNVAGTLMRVTAYPKTTHQPVASQMCRFNDGDQQWCQIEGGVDISGANYDADFRADPTLATNAQLLYAGLLTSGISSFMTPGETDTVQREVDLDSEKFRLARLSVSAVFLPEQRISDIKSCYYSNASARTDYQNFSREVGLTEVYSPHVYVPVIDQRALERYLCMYYEIAPNDVIRWLIGKRYVGELNLDLNNPQDPANEYPQIEYRYYLADRQGNRVPVGGDVSQKIREANPTGFYGDVPAEYAPGDPIEPKEKN